MTQPADKRLITEAVHNLTQAEQDARLALLENAAGFTEPPLGFEDAVVAGLLGDPASQSSAAAGGRFVAKGALVVNVKDYGAKGDGVTDDLVAFQQAYQALVAKGGGVLYVPAGKYLFSDEWNIYRANSPRVDIAVRGESQWTTFLLANFYGAGKKLITSRDSLGLTRISPTSFYHLQCGTVDRAGANPVLMDLYGLGESRLEGIRFGACNNTQLSVASLQNVRMRDVVAFNGGRLYPYKNTDALTFTTTTGGALTASGPIFDANDVGKIFTMYPVNGDNRAKYTISAVTSSTQATITGTTILAATNEKGGFDSAAASITAGTDTLTADAPCFTASDVGRVIYIRGARNGAWGEGNLRVTITAYTSPTTVTVSAPAELTVTRAPFGTPAVEFYAKPGAGTINADSNDVKIDTLHVENYSGIGLCTTPNIFFHIDKMKIHGEHSPTNTSASTASMWLDDYAGTINGELDGANTGDARIHVSGQNDLLTFEWLASRRIRNEFIIKSAVMTDPNAAVELKSFVSYRVTSSGNPYDLVSDPNTTPKVLFGGLVNMLGGSTPPRFYLGKDTYITANGVLVRGGSSTQTGFDAVWAGQSGARHLFEDIATKKYSIGNTAGGGTSFTITDESLALVRLLISSTGSVTPGVDLTQNLGSATVRWSGVYTNQLVLANGGVLTGGPNSPEGAVAAPKGSMYLRTGAGPTLYIKESGTDTTGWVAK